MNSDSNWRDRFAQGFSSGGDNTALIVGILIIVLLTIGFVVLDHYSKARRRQTTGKTGPSWASFLPQSLAPLKTPLARINPLQQKVIYELIETFRKQEPSAQAVPTTVLEKYSEFFFDKVGRLKTSPAEVRAFINQNYPLQVGDLVELDFHTGGSLHLIQSTVLKIGAKALLVDYSGQPPEFIKKGLPLFLNYSSGKHFLQGASVIIDVRSLEGLVLRKPEPVTLTSERSYARVQLDKANGSIHDPKTNFKSEVKVLDLSLEGCRVQVDRPLDKGHLFQLSFEVSTEGKLWGFGPLECVPSKTFMTSSGAVESGLVFLYLDLATKARLQHLMKVVAQQELGRKTP